MGIEIAENVNGAPDGRPAFVTVGTHHAREWPSNEATQEFGLELINGYKSGNADLKAIVQKGRTFVIPVLNVDGFDMTIESEGLNPDGSYTDPVDSGGTSGDQSEGSGAYKRKNCRAQDPAEQAIPCLARTYDPADGDDQSAHNDRGVDPNRNYGVSWGGPGSSSDIDSLTYHGPKAFSEPETRTFADWLRDQQVSLLFTNHTFSGLILRPPGTSVNGPAPDEQGLRQLGDAMAKNTTLPVAVLLPALRHDRDDRRLHLRRPRAATRTRPRSASTSSTRRTRSSSPSTTACRRPTTTATRRATSSAACAAPTRSPASRPSARRATTAGPRTTSDDLPGTHGDHPGHRAGRQHADASGRTSPTRPTRGSTTTASRRPTRRSPSRASRPSWSRPAASSCGTSTRRPSRTARRRRGS